MSEKVRTSLNLEQKINVILEHKKGTASRKLSEMFKCGRTQIVTIIRYKDQIISEWERVQHRGKKRKQDSNFEQLNDCIYEWVKCARVKGVQLNEQVLKKKALQIAKIINVQRFFASNDWLESFQHCYHIKLEPLPLNGEEDESKDIKYWQSKLSNIVSHYELRDIYAVNETGLFFRSVPNESLTFKNKACKTGKFAKGRVTVLLCCNALGDKEKLVIVGKQLKQRCLRYFDARLTDIKWCDNDRAWMTSTIFEEWLTEFNMKMIREKRNVLLLLDRTPIHTDIPLSNMRLFFLPTCKPELQPLSLRIILNFKMHYRKKVLQTVVTRVNGENCMPDVTKLIKLNDAVFCLKAAWNEVSDKVMKNSFSQCGFICYESEQLSPVLEFDNEELETLARRARVCYNAEAEAEHVHCFDTLDNDWETRLFNSFRGVPLSEEEGSDAESETDNKDESPMTLKEGIQVLQRLRSLCYAIDKQYGDNTIKSLNSLLNSFENCVFKAQCNHL